MGPQKPNDSIVEKLTHACGELSEPISDLAPIRLRCEEARVIENHLSHVRDFGASRLAKLSSCWSKNPSGHDERRPSASTCGEDTAVLPSSLEK